MVFQPKIALASGDVVGVEALVRWTHPRKGAVSPDRFVGDVERSFFGLAFDDFVLETAIAHATTFAAAGLHLPVAVNLSPCSLDDTGFPGKLGERLAAAGLPAELIEVEITERALDETGHADVVLDELARRGVSVALDDFGVGYSALKRLVRLPISTLKIDRFFISEMPANDRAAAIVFSAAELGRSLGLTVVAEGIEDAAVAEQLEALGVDHAQGFHFAAPLSPDDLLTWLDRSARTGAEGVDVVDDDRPPRRRDPAEIAQRAQRLGR